MKFKVRQGFVVHHERATEVIVAAGRKERQITTKSYWEGEDVDFTAAEAAAHLHKLEPMDKDAKAFVGQKDAA